MATSKKSGTGHSPSSSETPNALKTSKSKKTRPAVRLGQGRETARVARQSKDIALKIVADALRGDVLSRFGIHLPPIVAALPAEMPRLEVRSEATDLLFRLEDGSILHLEFQTKLTAGDLDRFFAYHVAVYLRYHRPVTTVVFYGAGITEAPDTVRTPQCVFQLVNVYVGAEDGDAVLERLREKVAQGATLTRDDQVGLIFSPLMRQGRTLAEVLPEAARLTSSLPREDRELTVGALLGLAYHSVEWDVIAAILEEFGMQSVLERYIEHRLLQAQEQGLARGLEQGLEQGRTEGLVAGKRVLLRTALEARFGTLPEALDARIASATADELDVLMIRAMAAEAADTM